MKAYRVAVVGATGAVGREIISCLAKSDIVVAELELFASPKSAGQQLTVNGQDWQVQTVGPEGFGAADIVFLATDSELSLELAPMALKGGAVVIDNSSAFRHDDKVSLVVPEINGGAIPQGPSIIANPNCSTIISLLAVGPLAQKFGVRRIIASTYQAVSGAGQAGLEELERSQAAIQKNDLQASEVFSAPIAENLIPWIGKETADGWTDEEEKMERESRKILENNDLRVVCTCVRVAVRRAHSISLHIELRQEVTREDVLSCWNDALGVSFLEDTVVPSALHPRAVEGENEVRCGRLRQTDSCGREWAFFVIGDQLLKGAALNAVQIAERWVRTRENRSGK